MRWSEDVTLKFVKVYLKHEALWNYEHPHYRIKHEREKAYRGVASDFSAIKQLSVPEIKVKIKHLRTTYSQQVTKILQRSSPSSMYEPTLVWFQEMDRCLKLLQNSRHPSNSTIRQTPEVDSSCQIWVGQEIDDTEQLNPDPLIPQTDTEPETSLPEEPLYSKTQCPPRKKTKKKIKKGSSYSFIDSNTLNSESMVREDEFDIYGKFIASQLRQMELQKALRLQIKIQTLVSEARISDLL